MRWDSKLVPIKTSTAWGEDAFNVKKGPPGGEIMRRDLSAGLSFSGERNNLLSSVAGKGNIHTIRLGKTVNENIYCEKTTGNAVWHKKSQKKREKLRSFSSKSLGAKKLEKIKEADFQKRGGAGRLHEV